MLGGSVVSRRIQYCLAGIVGMVGCGLAHAKLEVPALFSDHMVMQRDMEVPVWGWADAGEQITVSIGAQKKSAKANAAGKWMVRLDAMQPGTPRNMTVTGKSESMEVKDILLGEVWIASGQSNMAWQLKSAQDGKRAIAEANHPQIRLFNMPKALAPKAPSERLSAGDLRTTKYANTWMATSPEVAQEFSAVAYYFARDIHQSLRVPVGIIANAMPSSSIEAWISHDAFMGDPDFKAVAQYYDGLANYVENTAEGKKDLADRAASYEAKQASLRAQGKPLMYPRTYPGPLQSVSFATTYYNALIHPLVPYAIRGVIWYQGEAQSNRMYEYRGILPLLIKDWRARWGQGDFPFLYVQLPNWGKPETAPGAGGWAIIRESQVMTLKVPNTAMAVTIDVGDAADIHPRNKADVGARLAVAARGAVYGEKIVFSGPIYRGMKIERSSIRLYFDHVGRGLMAGKKTGLEPAMEDKGAKLQRFAVAGEDMKFVWGDAVIDKDTVVVSSPSVPNPVAVRYAWENNPEGRNLYNTDGLPASPFRTDESKPQPMGTYYKARLQKGFKFNPPK
jgi:sialate O-acetylesterase